MSASPDLVVTGRIATLTGTGGFGWAGGLAVTGGAVSAVGTSAEIERSAGPGTRRWRLPDPLCLLPGITDAHLHLGAAARAATALDLEGAADRRAILDRVGSEHRRLVASGDAVGWIEGHGWSLDRFGRWPTADDLEGAAPGRPIALWSHDHHARWVSHAALDRAGIGSAGDPAGLIRRDPSGAPSGVLHEGAAVLVDRALPAWDGDHRRAALEGYAPRLAALGITGVHDPGELQDALDLESGPMLYRHLAREGHLALRVTASVREPQLAAAMAAGFRTGRGEGRYRDGWLKLFADGALGSRSAALLAPWEPDDPAGPPVGDAHGMLTMAPEALRGLSGSAAAAGIAVQIHGIGDRAVRVALDVLGAIPAVPGVQHRVEHAQLVDPVDVPRFASHRVAASVQPCHLCTDMPAMRVAWGDRTRNAFPLAALVAAGVLIPFGTDAPVEGPDPWRGIAAAVSRADPSWPDASGPFHPEHALPVERALRAACVDPALVAGRSDLGCLGPGARADLLVVPVEPLLDPGGRGERLAAVRPLLTAIDGAVAYRDPSFDPDA